MRKNISILLLLAACGSPPPAAAPRPVGATSLVAREFTTTPEWGATTTTVWIDPTRVAGISVDDGCCGLWYDGAQYDDARATCAPEGTDECADDLWTVTPGLADDPVCGERRRCVPYPEARVVVLDASAVTATDMEGDPLPSGRDAAQVKHAPVAVTREGAFVSVEIGDRSQLVAVDHGVRYTIYVKGGAIERVARDGVVGLR